MPSSCLEAFSEQRLLVDRHLSSLSLPEPSGTQCLPGFPSGSPRVVCEGDWGLVVDHSGEKQGRRREDKATNCWLKSCCVYQVTGKKVKGDIYVEKEKE